MPTAGPGRSWRSSSTREKLDIAVVEAASAAALVAAARQAARGRRSYFPFTRPVRVDELHGPLPECRAVCVTL